MLKFDSAQILFANSVDAIPEAERIWTGVATRRVLATDVVARADLPSADKCSRDGYAIRAAECGDDGCLPLQQAFYAGTEAEALRPGHAIRVFAGSLVPQGADTVVSDECVATTLQGIRVLDIPEEGANICRQGEDVVVGTLLAKAGTVLCPGHIATLSSQGVEELQVVRLLEVGLVTTGNEVAVHEEMLARHQVHDVNGPMFESLVESMGAVVKSRRHVRDCKLALRTTMTELAEEVDLVLVTGGTSGATKNLACSSLLLAGGALLYQKVDMTPGKPVAVGRLRGKTVVCLPGNPADAYATFALLVTPMLRKQQGRAEIFPPVTYVGLAERRVGKSQGDEFLRVRQSTLGPSMSRIEVQLLQGEKSLSSLGESTGLIRVSSQHNGCEPEVFPYYDFSRWLF